MSASFFPPLGAIRSIQRGTGSITGSNTSATATISSVNTAKSVLTLLGANGTGGTDISITLTNSTTITATRGGSANTSNYVYQVVEYY